MNPTDSMIERASAGWIIGGALIGFWLEPNAIGALGGAGLGYALSQIAALHRSLHRVQQRLRLLEQAQGAQPAVNEVSPVQASPTNWATPASAGSAVATPVEPSAHADSPAAPDTTAQKPDRWSGAVRKLVDWFKGGNPLARAGVVVLFFGGAFLAKYAAERSHFPIELRFIALAAAAIGLLAVGWRLRESRSVYAQTLQGGGVAGLYLTVFAATRLYALLPPGAALMLMVVIVVAAAALAVTQNALALAVIGTAGGFMAPILISTGSSNHIALFAYYTVLNLGIFGIAWLRAWRVLNLVGLFFTFGITGAFRVTSYVPQQMLSTDLFVGLYFLLYVAVSVLFALRQTPNLRNYVSASLVFGLPLAAFGIHASLVAHIQYATAGSAFGLGVFYAALSWILLRSGRDNLRLLAEAFVALSVIFISLAVPLAFDAQTTSATWAVEGAGLLWLGVRQQRRLARCIGLLLQVLGGLGYWYGLHALAVASTMAPMFNGATLGAIMLAVAGMFSGLWLHRNRMQAAAYERGWDNIVGSWGCFWWVFAGAAEVLRIFHQDGSAALMVFFTLSALLYYLGAVRWQWPLPRRMALAMVTAAALAGCIGSVRAGHPFACWLGGGWLLTLAIHYLLLWREDAEGSATQDAGNTARHVGAVWLLAALLTFELDWRIGHALGGVWRELAWGLVPAMLLWPLSHGSLKPAWPLMRHEDAYRRISGSLLAAVALAWIAIVSVSSSGNPQPLPYLPLLNPLDLAVICVFALVINWWRSLESSGYPRLTVGLDRISHPLIVLLAFLWLNSALLRALHYLADTPLSLDGAMHSLLVQAALSVFWSLLGFGAMTLATRRAQRTLWMGGAALMSAVVVKLFLIDLDGSGTLERIVSFLIVGGVLVVTGYVSPLPPRTPSTTD